MTADLDTLLSTSYGRIGNHMSYQKRVKTSMQLMHPLVTPERMSTAWSLADPKLESLPIYWPIPATQEAL